MGEAAQLSRLLRAEVEVPFRKRARGVGREQDIKEQRVRRWPYRKKASNGAGC